MQRPSWLRHTAALAVLAFGLAACSSGDATDGTAPDPADEAAAATPTPQPEAAPQREADGRFVLGYILPESGELAFLGPPQIAAVEFAVALANEAGGVLGQPVELRPGDEAGDTAIAAQTAARLLAEGVDGIVGAGSSSMTLSFIEAVIGAGVPQCSASNTSPTFTDYRDDGWYFRTAPTDALQGPVLAGAVIDDGHEEVAILARSDDYGQGLLAATQAALEGAGVRVTAVTYDHAAVNVSAEVEQATAAEPDAVVLISFSEAGAILKQLVETGFGPRDVAVYGADGLRSNRLWQEVDPSDQAVLEGVQGTAPDPGADAEFLARLEAHAPDLDETIFAAQAFDCATLLLLAAEAAGTDAGPALATAVLDVSRGGIPCTSFAECRDLLAAGEDIDYRGASGEVDLTDAGEPDRGTYEVWRIGPDGRVTTIDRVESRLD